MGSRILSATTGPGAVTQADFIKAFSETKPVELASKKDLFDKLGQISEELVHPDFKWEKKAKALVSLRGLLISNFPNIRDVMVDCSSLWEKILVDGMKELRSSLFREYCITVAFFAVKLGVQLFPQIKSLIGTLINVVQSSIKIMSSVAFITTEFVVKHVQHAKLVHIVAGFYSSKSAVIRRYVVHLSRVIMLSWSSDYLESQNLVKIIMEIVKSGCCDADIQCRQMGREAYFVLAEKYPDEARIVFESLDPPRQKMINEGRSVASSAHSFNRDRGDSSANHQFQLQQSRFMSRRARSEVSAGRVTPTRNVLPKPTEFNPKPPAKGYQAKPLAGPVSRSPTPKRPIRAHTSVGSVAIKPRTIVPSISTPTNSAPRQSFKNRPKNASKK